MQYKPQINFLIFSILFFCFGFCTTTFAQSASTTSTINAEILSNIWYSTTTVNEGDNISIYAGFQNHSSKDLSGTAGFFVDDIEISKVTFTANSKSLIKLETKYTAVRGEHTTQVKILDIDGLLASETEKKSLSVKYQITTTEILNTAQSVTNSVINTVDLYAQKAADYVESLIQPTGNEKATSSKTSTQIAQEKSTGKVLGTSTENLQSTSTQKTATSWQTHCYNIFLSILAFLLRHWIWTSIVIIIFILYLTLK